MKSSASKQDELDKYLNMKKPKKLGRAPNQLGISTPTHKQESKYFLEGLSVSTTGKYQRNMADQSRAPGVKKNFTEASKREFDSDSRAYSTYDGRKETQDKDDESVAEILFTDMFGRLDQEHEGKLDLEFFVSYSVLSTGRKIFQYSISNRTEICL